MQATKIFVNGVWTGIHRKPQELVSTLRKMRREVCIAPAELEQRKHIIMCRQVFDHEPAASA